MTRFLLWSALALVPMLVPAQGAPSAIVLVAEGQYPLNLVYTFSFVGERAPDGSVSGTFSICELSPCPLGTAGNGPAVMLVSDLQRSAVDPTFWCASLARLPPASHWDIQMWVRDAGPVGDQAHFLIPNMGCAAVAANPPGPLPSIVGQVVGV